MKSEFPQAIYFSWLTGQGTIHYLEVFRAQKYDKIDKMGIQHNYFLCAIQDHHC